MKRGLKVKSGVREPAMLQVREYEIPVPSFPCTTQELDSALDAIDDALGRPRLVRGLVGLPSCPNNNNCGQCWYCKQQAPR